MSVHVCGYVCARASGCGCGCVCMLYRCILPGPSPPGQEVKRSRGYGGYGGVTHAHTDRPVAHHGRPPTGELRRQGPTGPSSALSPVPLALGPPPPIPLRQLANWPAATRQPDSPPNSPPTPSPRPRPIAPRARARATASVPTSRVPSPAVRRVQRALANLDSTRLDSTRLELASTRARVTHYRRRPRSCLAQVRLLIDSPAPLGHESGPQRFPGPDSNPRGRPTSRLYHGHRTLPTGESRPQVQDAAPPPGGHARLPTGQLPWEGHRPSCPSL